VIIPDTLGGTIPIHVILDSGADLDVFAPSLWLANYYFAQTQVFPSPSNIVRTRIVGLSATWFSALNVVDFKGVQTGPSCGEAQPG